MAAVWSTQLLNDYIWCNGIEILLDVGDLLFVLNPYIIKMLHDTLLCMHLSLQTVVPPEKVKANFLRQPKDLAETLQTCQMGRGGGTLYS